MRNRHLTNIAGLLLAAAAGPLAAAPPAEAQRPSFRPASCGELPRGVRAGRDLRCGSVAVPERHRRSGGGRIRLAVRVVRSRAANPGTPVLVLGGGPGEGVTGLAVPFTQSTLRRDRDIVLLDQRGTGAGSPVLRCTPETSALAPTDGLPELQSAYAACAKRLRARTDLDAYKTLENARDLGVVRRALGYERMHVFGTSYGARLALIAARDSPRWISSLVLSSPVPAEANFVDDAPRSFQRALDAVFADCAASADCNRRFPDLAAKLDDALTRLEQQPAPLPPGAPLPALDAATATTLVFALFYSAEGVASVPAVITKLAAGDYADLVRSGSEFVEATQGLADGMQRAFICSEELAFADRARFEVRLGGLGKAAQILGRTQPTIGLPSFPICDAFGVRRASPVTFRPVSTRIPALVVVGRYDQITPPSYGRRVARRLPRAQLLTFPTGHSPLFASGRCGLDALRSYLRRPGRGLREPRSCRIEAARASGLGVVRR